MNSIKKLRLICVVAVSLLSIDALACSPFAPFIFEHDANTNKTYVTYRHIGSARFSTDRNWTDGKIEIALGKGYKEVVESERDLDSMPEPYQRYRDLDIHSRYASDGINAYVIDYAGEERQIIGAKDYKTLTPLLNSPTKGSSRYHWRYYRDKFSFYSAEVAGRQTVLKPLADFTDQFRVVHGLLVIMDRVYMGSQLLTIKGSELKLTLFNDKFDFISDGRATYATRNLTHVKGYRPDLFFDIDQKVDEPQVWYGQQGWIKLVDNPTIKLIGSVHNKYSGSTCGRIDRYDVIFEAEGQVYFNKTALISNSASSDEKLAAIFEHLQKFNLYRAKTAEQEVKSNVSSPVYNFNETTLHYIGKDFSLFDKDRAW